MRAVDDDREQSDVPKPGAIKGLRIATRCVTVEQFVENYHQICEDSAIFIPNTHRPAKTVLQFRFDLHDGNPALLGVGTVVEELTTNHNRFDHVGIVVELQRLSRASAVTFDQMLAVRARTKLAAPAPVYPRAMTVPIDVASKSERMTTEPPHQAPRIVPIPLPTAEKSSARTKAVIGLPTLAKKPTVRIPAIIAPPTPKQSSAIPTERPTPITVQPAARQPLEPRMPVVLAPSVPSSIDDGWDSIASKIDDASMTGIDLATPPVDQPLTVPPEDHASPTTPTTTTVDSFVACAAEPDPFDTVTTVEAVEAPTTPTMTAVERLVACAAEPDPFETVTAVESPDGFLLALMRRDDGRAAPVVIEAAPPTSFAISEPMQPFVADRFTPAVIERTFAPPTIAAAARPAIAAPFASINAPLAMPAIDHAALAGAPIGAARRSWRWLAAAGAFAVLLCATAATFVFVDRPAASVPPSTFAPAHESPLDSSPVATAREQAPTVADPNKPPAPVAPPAIAKSKSSARPSAIERPAPLSQPATRPLRRPAPRKKCRDLRCL